MLTIWRFAWKTTWDLLVLPPGLALGDGPNGGGWCASLFGPASPGARVCVCICIFV
mgnify:CR=1 FL=1